MGRRLLRFSIAVDNTPFLIFSVVNLLIADHIYQQVLLYCAVLLQATSTVLYTSRISETTGHMADAQYTLYTYTVRLCKISFSSKIITCSVSRE